MVPGIEDARTCSRCHSEMTLFAHQSEWYCKGCGNRTPIQGIEA